MKTVGVIGAGQMGAGIAQVSAQAGYAVLLSDVDQARAEAGKAGIAKQLGRAVEKEKISAEDAEAALGRITCVGGTDAFAPCDLVIEAATEREAIKRQIFESVGKVLGSEAIGILKSADQARKAEMEAWEEVSISTDHHESEDFLETSMGKWYTGIKKNA